MFPWAIYCAAGIIYLCSVHAEQISGTWCTLCAAVHTHNRVSSDTPSKFLSGCDCLQENLISSCHAGDQLGVATVHVAVALAGDLYVCCHGENGHAGSVFSDEACRGAGFCENNNEFRLYVKGGLHS